MQKTTESKSHSFAAQSAWIGIVSLLVSVHTAAVAGEGPQARFDDLGRLVVGEQELFTNRQLEFVVTELTDRFEIHQVHVYEMDVR